MNKSELTDALEQFVDSEGLQDVIGILSDICYEKASHCLSNWQDKALAKRWETAGAYLAKVWDHQAITGAPL